MALSRYPTWRRSISAYVQCVAAVHKQVIERPFKKDVMREANTVTGANHLQHTVCHQFVQSRDRGCAHLAQQHRLTQIADAQGGEFNDCALPRRGAGPGGVEAAPGPPNIDEVDFRCWEAVAALRTASATIDGETVWCDRDGLAVFDKLHSRTYDGEVILYAFDLLELNGEDWRPRPLEERKAKLAKLLRKAPAGIHYSEHLEGDGAAIFAHACRLGAEGIVSKHREHSYRSGPSKVWLKIKNPQAPGMLRFREEP
jgi:hypothetical protein